jgi:hypothetical protein
LEPDQYLNGKIFIYLNTMTYAFATNGGWIIILNRSRNGRSMTVVNCFFDEGVINRHVCCKKQQY